MRALVLIFGFGLVAGMLGVGVAGGRVLRVAFLGLAGILGGMVWMGRDHGGEG